MRSDTGATENLASPARTILCLRAHMQIQESTQPFQSAALKFIPNQTRLVLTAVNYHGRDLLAGQVLF
jgi:hypothetical protein